MMNKSIENIDDIYIDQSINQIRIHDIYISSVYTPFGIKQIDSMFTKRIINLNEDPNKLRKEIEDNHHLHKTIKDNLITNLNNKVK